MTVENPVPVQIPNAAVSDGTDVSAPTATLLRNLSLLGNRDENRVASGPGAVFSGPPESVALIEAGATAASKWWATGLGATVAAAWTVVAAWWSGEPEHVQEVALAGAAVLTSALALAIGHLIASDVRGRAAAAVATVQARADVARAMLAAAQSVYEPPSAAAALPEIVPLPGGIRAKNTLRPSEDEDGWHVIAMQRDGDGQMKYVVVKGSAEQVVPAVALHFA